METIYTIPINEKFELSMQDKSCGCPFCSLYRKLENAELDRILGASMMEPDVRIRTNEEGFCRTHYDMMFGMKNRLGMALTMESHLHDLQKDLKDSLLGAPGQRAIRRIEKLEGSCYVCGRIEYHFSRMIENAVEMWNVDEDFRQKYASQPYFCLPHYKRFLETAAKKLSKNRYKDLAKAAEAVEMPYLDKLSEDISWFCKKSDYRYDSEPWYDSKDAVERTIKFLRSDLHIPDKKPGGGAS